MEFDESGLDAWCARHGGLSSVRYLSMKNSASETKRREGFTKTFAPLFPSKLQFVDGVNGKELLAADPSLDGQVDSLSWLRITRGFDKEDHTSLYTVGAVGCALSHLRELEHAASATGCTLVIESDVGGVDQTAWAKLTAEFPLFPDEVDILWLNTYKAHSEQPLGKTISRMMGPIQSMVAILYTPRGAAKMLDLIYRNDRILTNQIDGIYGAVFARYPDSIVAARTNEDVVLLDELMNMTTSNIQTLSIKSMLPDENWFYALMASLLLIFLISTSTIALQLKRIKRRRERGVRGGE